MNIFSRIWYIKHRANPTIKKMLFFPSNSENSATDHEKKAEKIAMFPEGKREFRFKTA